jgi:hypothetical protein
MTTKTPHPNEAREREALIARLQAFEDPQQTDLAEWEDLDWRAFCGRCWRALASLEATSSAPIGDSTDSGLDRAVAPQAEGVSLTVKDAVAQVCGRWPTIAGAPATAEPAQAEARAPISDEPDARALLAQIRDELNEYVSDGEADADHPLDPLVARIDSWLSESAVASTSQRDSTVQRIDRRGAMEPCCQEPDECDRACVHRGEVIAGRKSAELVVAARDAVEEGANMLHSLDEWHEQLVPINRQSAMVRAFRKSIAALRAALPKE